MAKEKLETLTQEEQEKQRQPIKFKCKPTFNFQSVEFEYEVHSNEELDDMFDIYSMVLDNLMYLAPEQPSNTGSKKAAKEPADPATEAQLNILRKFNIKFKKNISKKQASDLIKKSMAKSVKHSVSEYSDFDDEEE